MDTFTEDCELSGYDCLYEVERVKYLSRNCASGGTGAPKPGEATSLLVKGTPSGPFR